MNPIDLTDHPNKTPQELVERLAVVSSELSGLYQEHSMVQASEHRAKAAGYGEDPTLSVAARERAASRNALEHTCTLFEIRGQIYALNEERAFLYFLLGADDGRRTPVHHDQGLLAGNPS